jgi:tetratricopeptide (TPR) repeat protein
LTQPLRIGRYEIEKDLGDGGFGSVYLASDPEVHRRVAIRLLHAQLPSTARREHFRLAASAASALLHPNIASIYDFGEFETHPYLVLEYVEGQTLAAAVAASGSHAIVRSLRWLEQLCAGLDSAHRAGTLHRNIKPANLIVDDLDRLKILDFGVTAIAAGHTRGSESTGTVGYLPPEYIQGGAADRRTDIFSVGAVAYQILTQREPFPGETAPAVRQRVLACAPEPLRDPETGADLDPQLADIVMRALQKSPDRRYQDVREMEQAFSEIRGRVERELGASAAPGSSQPAWLPVDADSAKRRRDEMIAAALDRAESDLAAGRLEQAMAACVEAATLGEHRPDTTDLTEWFGRALDVREAEALVATAHQEYQRDMLETALELIERARGLSPDVSAADALEAEIRLKLDERERQRRPAESQVHITAARAALAANVLAAALDSVQRAIAVDPSSDEAKDLLRLVQSRLAEREAGQKRGDAAISDKRVPPAPAISVDRTHAASSPGQLDAPDVQRSPASATPAGSREVRRSGETPVPAAGGVNTARRDLEQHLAAAEAAFKAGDWPRALSAVENAIRLDPMHPRAYALQAEIEEAARRKPAAPRSRQESAAGKAITVPAAPPPETPLPLPPFLAAPAPASPPVSAASPAPVAAAPPAPAPSPAATAPPAMPPRREPVRPTEPAVAPAAPPVRESSPATSPRREPVRPTDPVRAPATPPVREVTPPPAPAWEAPLQPPAAAAPVLPKAPVRAKKPAKQTGRVLVLSRAAVIAIVAVALVGVAIGWTRLRQASLQTPPQMVRNEPPPATNPPPPKVETPPKVEPVVPAKQVDPQPTKQIDPQPQKQVDPQPTKQIDPQPTKRVDPQPTKQIDPQPRKQIDTQQPKQNDRDRGTGPGGRNGAGGDGRAVVVSSPPPKGGPDPSRLARVRNQLSGGLVREAVEQAGELRREFPNDSQVAALFNLTQDEMLAAIRRTMDAAASSENSGNWLAALQQYEIVGRLDPSAGGWKPSMERVKGKMNEAATTALKAAKQYDAADVVEKAIKSYEDADRNLLQGDPRKTDAKERLAALRARK